MSHKLSRCECGEPTTADKCGLCKADESVGMTTPESLPPSERFLWVLDGLTSEAVIDRVHLTDNTLVRIRVAGGEHWVKRSDLKPLSARQVQPVAYRIDYPGLTDTIGLRRFCGEDEYQSFRPTIEFLGGVFVPPYTQSPTAVPPYTQSPTAVPEDVRMQAKMYRWLRDCAPADWLSRVCNVFSKRGAAFDEEVRAAMSAENGGV